MSERCPFYVRSLNFRVSDGAHGRRRVLRDFNFDYRAKDSAFEALDILFRFVGAENAGRIPSLARYRLQDYGIRGYPSSRIA